MTLEKELQALYEFYSQQKLDQRTLLKLDASFIKIINQQLLADGPTAKDIERNYKRITQLLHPDRSPNFPESIRWLNGKLSPNNDNGYCFIILRTCFEKLTEPQKFKDIQFGDIKSREDFRGWLVIQKNKATTYTGKSFCDSLIALFEQSSHFFDEAGKLKPVGLRSMVSFIPMVISLYGAFIVAEELLALYAVYFILLKSGKYLERNESEKLQKLGIGLKDISFSGALSTAALIARLLEMTFWASNQCLHLSLEVGTAILKPLLSPTVEREAKYPPREPYSPESLRKDLIIASDKCMDNSSLFNTPELQVVAAPLIAYKELNDKQIGRSYRLGHAKNKRVGKILFDIGVLDKENTPLLDKLTRLYAVLQMHKKDEQAYAKGSKTAAAIDDTEQVITLLIEQQKEDIKLLAFEKPEERSIVNIAP